MSTASTVFGPYLDTSPSGWTFDPIELAVTCEFLEIPWTVNQTQFTDIDTPMALSLLNGDGSAVPADAGTITSKTSIDAGLFDWSAVTVPAGQYLVKAVEAESGFIIYSNSFQVTNGGNTSCIPADALAASNPSSSSTSGSSTSSSSSNSATTSPTGSSSSSQNATFPVIGGLSEGKPKGAAIAGGVVGGLVGIALILLCAWYFLASRKRAALLGKQRPLRDGWGGLDSVDYKPTSSVTHALGAGSNAATPRPSIATTRSGFTDRDYLPPISAQPSLASLREKTLMPSPTNGSPISPYAHELSHLPGTPIPGAHRSREGSTSSISPVPDPFATPATDKAARRSSRTQRKPVPAYKPTTEEMAQLALARSQSESGQSVTRSEMSAATQQGGSPPGSAMFGNVDTDAMIHGLKSKSSGNFEFEKPMHYLMPDPPRPPPS
ncbi:hypothetical protein M422DRAFT_23160 [Sphaerobolus stellatus SS14]|nr:hypothetical protein M422DRAFT_23160 [Sphaerobolus stellatus SS14]